MNKFIKSHYFLIFVLAIINLLIAFFLIQTPLRLNGDAPSYLGAMKIIQGQEYNVNLGENAEMFLKGRILTTPLMLYSSIFAGKITGNEYSGMLLINIIFYFLIIYVFYKLIYLIYNNHLVACLGTILFFANYCMYNYGTTYRTDIGGWFFFLLATFLAVKYFKEPTREKWFYLSILASSIGVLFKEYGALGMIPLGILILLMPVSLKDKIKKILKAAVLFLIIPILYHLFIYFRFHFSYLDWYNFAFKGVINNPDSPGINWSVILLAKVLGWLYLVGWPIFFWGAYQEYKDFNKQRIKILSAIFPASVAFLAWPGLTQRIAFVFVPWLIMISAFGLSKIKKKYIIVLILIVYLLVNYFTRPWLLQLINI